MSDRRAIDELADYYAEEREPAVVQTYILSKERFEELEDAMEWMHEQMEARGGDMHADKHDETEDSWRFRQRDPGDFEAGSFRTMELTSGVKAVVGRLK